MTYESFVASKLAPNVPTGIHGAEVDGNHLFEFQRELVQWALRRGRAALFASTGLGKTRMQLAWGQRVAEYAGKPVLVLAPLAVAQQTFVEGRLMHITTTVVKDGAEVEPGTPHVYVTNYDRLHRFDASVFGGIVLDESSIIKHHNAKTLQALLVAFARTPFRLACTATPAPNDYVELGTHAEFLGICTRAEMLSEFFVHDGGDTQSWRLKGHARQAFWRFVASWAALVRSPADLGYDGSDYELPPLSIEHHVIEADDEAVRAAGMLFAVPAKSLMERRQARKDSIGQRVERCADLILANQQRWVIWCDLNAEQDALATALGDACVSIYGSLDPEEKVARYERWLAGEVRCLLSKPSIFGYGCNMQSAHHMAFVGVTDSWEAYHQAVRRIWRFGQRHACHVHVFASELEGSVIANLQRKERDASAMAEELSRETAAMVREAVQGSVRETNVYAPGLALRLPAWCSADDAERLAGNRPRLSNSQIDEMLAAKAAGESIRSLAKRFSVSPSTVSEYCSGKKRRSA